MDRKAYQILMHDTIQVVIDVFFVKEIFSRLN